MEANFQQDGVLFETPVNERRRRKLSMPGEIARRITNLFQKKNLLITFTLLSVFAIFVIALLCYGLKSELVNEVVLKPEASHEFKGPLCLSPLCVEAAEDILDAMNLSADPCDDFYNFACGGYTEKNENFDPHTFASTYTTARYRMIVQFRNGLLSSTLDASHKNESEILNLAKKAFITCIARYSTIDERILMDFYHELGEWPLLIGNKWNPDNVDWIKSAALALNKADVASFIGLSIVRNPKNTLQNIISIGKPPLAPRLDEYTAKTFVLNFAKMLRNKKKEQILEDFHDILETAAYIRKMHEQHYSDEDKILTISQLESADPTINWLGFFKTVFQGMDYEITSDERILVRDISYFQELGNDIKSGHLRMRSVMNYINWVVTISLDFLLSSVRETCYWKHIPEHRFPVQAREKEKCLEEVSNTLNYAMEHMFLKKPTKQEANQIKQIIISLRTAFKDNIRETKWIDDETRKLIFNKIDQTTLHMFEPNWVAEPGKLVEFYSDLNFGEEPFQNYFKMKQFLFKKKVAQLKKDTDRNEWPITIESTAYNAYNLLDQNAIVMGLGYMIYPFFDTKLPLFIGYARTGTILAHALTHSFGEEGNHRNAKGDLMDWWHPESYANFLKLKSCMEFKYSSYRQSHNESDFGEKTFEENMADAASIRQSFRAYKLWEQKYGPDHRLPGLEMFTAHQMFFISNAWMECATSPTVQVMKCLLADIHTPGEYRVIGSLSNSEDFAKAFSCKVGTYMNPKNKCVIW